MMAADSIPVDLFNPGQVFACMGFLEAAETLLGDAECRFDWADEADVRFHLEAAGTTNPFEVVLAFLASAEILPVAPAIGYEAKRDVEKEEEEAIGGDADGHVAVESSQTFPAAGGDQTALPIRLRAPGHPTVEIGHWVDGSCRETFKLYSGNRSAFGIARAMLSGTRDKPKKRRAVGDLKTRGMVQLWEEQREAMIRRPFDVLTPMGGSFNFDPRGAWTAIDAGYSPDDQKPKHRVSASPLVELLAAWGVENARPNQDGVHKREVRYAAWRVPLPAMLARPTLFGGMPWVTQRRFRFELAMSGKNKVVTFAQEEPPL